MFVQIDTSWFYICACGCWYQGFSGFLIDDGQLYEAWRAIAAKQRLRTKWRPSWRWCRVGHELFISDLLYSFSFSLWVLDFHHMTKAFESISGGVVFFSWFFQYVSYQNTKGRGSCPRKSQHRVVRFWKCYLFPSQKNLHLGEDQYLTMLMLKTFPKCKNVFCPKAVCKTIVPDTFRVLLSQQRHWINFTIHSPAEPVLVRDVVLSALITQRCG